MSSHKKYAKEHLNKLETTLDLYLIKKAPALPKNIKELLVKFVPWLVIIGAALSVPGILSIFGATAVMTSNPYGAAVAATLGPTYYLSIALLVVVVALEVFALPGLFAKKKAGWNFLFYATLVSALSSLVSFNLGGFIIGTLIGLYLLFQVKEYYK